MKGCRKEYGEGRWTLQAVIDEAILCVYCRLPCMGGFGRANTPPFITK